MAALRQKSKHVPFRNSKLTFLLQDCLCGSGKTLMMCQVHSTRARVGHELIHACDPDAMAMLGWLVV